MEDRKHPPWLPAPFSVAVLDSDPFLGDTLGALLRERGLAPSIFYDAAAFLAAHEAGAFDAYVLDAASDWPSSTDLGNVVDAVRGKGGAVPVFILGNHTAPERVEGLGQVLMRHRLRYVLRPARVAYVAAQLVEELARGGK